MYVYMCTPDAHSGQEKVSDSPGLELSMVVSHHVSAGNQTLWPSAREASAHNC